MAARLLDVLNPNNEPGRITLIHRMGAENVADAAAAARRGGARDGPPRAVGLRSDARQHRDDGRGHQDPAVRQDRRRARAAFEIHTELGSHLGGVHFELTGEDVTECIGGARGLAEADLERAYKIAVDPRLNYEQALEMAMLIGGRLRTHD